MSSHDIMIPRVSDSMEEATVSRWIKSDGEQVSVGDALVEIETDKSSMEIEAEADGYVRILVNEGVTAGVGTAIGVIEAVLSEAAARPEAEPQVDGGASEPGLEDRPADQNEAQLAVATLPPAPSPPFERQRVAASPLARRVAVALSVDLAAVVGSGLGGRIHRRDVELAAQQHQSADAAPAISLEPLTRIQSIVARRMTEAKQQIPHYYVTTQVDMSAALELRASLISDGLRLSLNDVVIFAVSRALVDNPVITRGWSEAGFVVPDGVHIGLAVALDDGGLVVPVLRDADRRSLGGIATATRDLAERARTGRLAPLETQGGSFTISNLGMFGVTEFHAIINPPESSILAVGATVDQVVPRGGEVVIRPMMTVSLSSDHRVYSGATAAAFLARVRSLLEQPLGLLAR